MPAKQAEELVDNALQKVLQVTLNPSHATDSIVYLEETAKELRNSGAKDPILLSKDLLDRIVVERMRICTAPSPSRNQPWPLFYLMGAWARASDMRNRIQEPHKEIVVEALRFAREMLTNYAALLLIGIFEQPSQATARGTLQLLDAYDLAFKAVPEERIHAESKAHGLVEMPYGFFPELVATEHLQDADSLKELLKPIMWELVPRFTSMTPMENYDGTMQIFLEFGRIPLVASAMVQLAEWLPQRLDNGRTIQAGTLMGRPMALSVLTDLGMPVKNLRAEFANASIRSASGDTQRTISAMRALQNSVQAQLFQLVKGFVRHKGSREAMIQWLGKAIESNATERGKIQMNPQAAASDGFFINLSAVLLQLCQPFIDPESDHARTKIDPRYVLQNTRMSFKEDTKMAMDLEEQNALLERARSGAEATPSFGFTSDCFFMTSKALNLGLIKALAHLPQIGRDSHTMEQELEHVQQVSGSQGSPLDHLLRTRMAHMQRILAQQVSDYYLLYSSVLEEQLLRSALGFYRLQAAWLLRLACPSYAVAPAAMGPKPQPSLPLPSPAPVAFRSLPEYMVTDMLELLVIVSRLAPTVFGNLPRDQLEEFMMFIVVFLSAPEYVHNPYVRSRMAEVLRYWLPESDDTLGSRGRRNPVAVDVLQDLIDTQSLAQTHLVRSLLKLYADIEHTGRNQAFYEKFGCRQVVGEILEYLWNVPVHRQRWKEIATEDLSEDGLYGRFCHHLETDAIYLLNDAMETLPKIRDAEQRLDSADAGLTDQQRQELRHSIQRLGDQVRSDLTLSSVNLQILKLSTTEITEIWLSPFMAKRIAAMLNFFLRHLTGKDRSKLKIKDPAKFGWKPLELLMLIARIYLNLYRADAQAISRAIASDGQSYTDDMFGAALETLAMRRHAGQALDMQEMHDLGQLAGLVREAKEDLMQVEAEEEDAPEEFLDALMSTVMEDPVLLPNSKQHVDRATITRHLLSDPHDPFTRAALTAEMLIPATDLKKRIEAWRNRAR